MIEELTVTAANLDLSAGNLNLSAAVIGALNVPTVLTTDYSMTSNVFANVGIALTVAANTRYYFEFFINFETSGGAHFFSINGPASPSVIAYDASWYNNLTSGTGKEDYQTYGAYDAADLTGTLTTLNAHNIARVSGYLQNGANAGSINLRVKAATGTITVRKGSHGILRVV